MPKPTMHRTSEASQAETSKAARRNEVLFGLCIFLVLMAILPFSNEEARPRLRYLNTMTMKGLANEHVKLREKNRGDHVPSQQDLKNFHNQSWHRIRELVNMSTVLSWKPHTAFLDFYRMWDDMGTLDHNHHAARWNEPQEDLVFGYDLFAGKEAYNGFLAEHPQGKPHVLLTRFYENFGALSIDVFNRTWGAGDRYSRAYNKLDDNPLMQYWDGRDPTYNLTTPVMEYLNNDNVKAVFVTSHQSLDHPKVHSIPIGTKKPAQVVQAIEASPTPANKTQLLMINFNTGGNAYRTRMLPKLLARFNGTVKNTYGSGQAEFLMEVQRSKFVLCPSGVGLDSYRAWETLNMGSFPIMETLNRSDGYYRIFDDLPVLFVENMETDVTPELLESSYVLLASNHHNYNYEKLTKAYWKELVDSYRPSKREVQVQQ